MPVLKYWDGAQWVPVVGGPFVSATAPTSPDDNKVWVDTDDGGAATLKFWTGSQWQYVGSPAGVGSNLTTLTIVETAVGVWSADAPARTTGSWPIRFIGTNDPAGANGVDTPANIEDYDTWTIV